MQELVKLAGPSVVRSIGHGLHAYEKGASASEALKGSGDVLKRGLKRERESASSHLPLEKQRTETYK